MVPLDSLVLFVVVVSFGATLLRSTLGFGEALVAVPLLALVLPVKVAAPIAVLLSITVAAVIVAQDWRHVQVRSAVPLVLSTLIGIPLGLLLLRSVSEPIVKGLLGAMVVGFAVSALRSRGSYELTDDRLAWLFGVSAGVLGGAYGMNGPPLVVYGALRRWSPEHFRATLQGYFLPASVIGMIGYWAAGLWTPSVSRYYLLSLPTALLAIVLGRRINRRVDARRFSVYVHAGLIVSGAGLVLQALVTWIAHRPAAR
ncbi:MAG: sulfite exporter TauE/SafE family protein [Usitatibacter sp.]